MISIRTTLILGAGASCHLDFPTGATLIDKVRDQGQSDLRTLENRSEESNWLNEVELDYYNSLKALLPRIQGPRPPSIDWLLSKHPDCHLAGKNLIAKVILTCEAEFKDSIAHRGGWYHLLLNALVSTITNPKQLHDNQIRVVTFNYDRSLEFYLVDGLRRLFADADQLICRFLEENLRIAHVYGNVGNLPWPWVKENKIDYGTSIKTLADHSGIRVIGEERTSREELKKAHDNIGWAERLIFLGFGFLPQNLDQLDFRNLANGKRVYATGKDLSEPKRQNVAGILARHLSPHPHIGGDHVFLGDRNFDCSMFLNESVLLDAEN